MRGIIEKGSLLLAESTWLPESLRIKSEAYIPGWRFITTLDSAGLTLALTQSGGNFLLLSQAIESIAWGKKTDLTTRKAIERIITKIKAESFNCLEIDQVREKQFLGMTYVNVIAYSRHIQRSLVFFDHQKHSTATIA